MREFEKVCYFNNKGRLHRITGPAVTEGYGVYTKMSWYVEGVLHRNNLPAITITNGSGYWYRYGKFLKVTFNFDHIMPPLTELPESLVTTVIKQIVMNEMKPCLTRFMR